MPPRTRPIRPRSRIARNQRELEERICSAVVEISHISTSGDPRLEIDRGYKPEPDLCAADDAQAALPVEVPHVGGGGVEPDSLAPVPSDQLVGVVPDESTVRRLAWARSAPRRWTADESFTRRSGRTYAIKSPLRLRLRTEKTDGHCSTSLPWCNPSSRRAHCPHHPLRQLAGRARARTTRAA